MPPFNGFQYLDNATLLQEAIVEHQSNPELGCAHVAGSDSPIKPWPKNQYGRTVTPFCYVDRFTRNRIVSTRYEAWSRGYDTIGTPHVFGLEHEHQRTDRDSYVHFACENLAKYDHVKAELVNQNTPYTLEDLCTSPSASRAEPWVSMGFGAYSYSTHPYWETEHKDSRGWFDDWKHEYKLTIGRQYDLNLIMRYHSYRNHEHDVEVQVPLTVMNLPLVKWRNGGPEFVPPQQVTAANVELIPMTYDGGPSAEDVEPAKVMYLWGR